MLQFPDENFLAFYSDNMNNIQPYYTMKLRYISNPNLRVSKQSKMCLIVTFYKVGYRNQK